MASISKRMVGSQPRYDVNYREPDGRRRRKTFRRKADADAFAVGIEADKARGEYVDRDAGRVTFKVYAERWLASQTFDQTSREVVERQFRLHVYPVLGTKQLRSIKPSTIQAWLRGLEVSSGTYRKHIFGSVSSVFAAAVDDDELRKNPCQADSVRKRAPKRDTRKVVPWTVEQVAAVTNALPERYRIAATLAAGLGLRQGEVFGLAVEDVDFLRGEVTVRRQVRLFSRGGMAFRSPKGGTQRDTERTIPLPATVRDALSAYLAAHPARPVTLPWGTTDGKPVTVDLVLTTRDGGPCHRNNFNRRIWTPALVAAGVESSRENGMHACRHFYASVLLDAGESIKAVSEYLGHSDAGFTLRTYTHLMPSSGERTKRAVDDVLGRYMGATSVAL